ncbi:hypothetical protein [Colwellia sp. Bg11-28]|uniref:hypothetical protein n=1 Tax=Colwellia sp. Bg11-28 TaxID=2058305 RepID=UPI000C33E528|nr:hypothetical protein [Colwellia sp. Bg11-28]PKH88905.1 hypothetical protein CXF79_03195 [Colwellia sp. Bg11-28]
MAFQNKRRKSFVANKIEEVSLASVSYISIDSLEINFNGSIAYFRRLKYRGCPKLILNSLKKLDFNKKDIQHLKDMNRNDFVMSMYNIFLRYSTHSTTAYGRFAFLARFVSFLDTKEVEAEISNSTVRLYLENRNLEVLKGSINKNTLQKDKSHLVNLLKELGMGDIARDLPEIKNRRQAAIPTDALPDNDRIDIAKKLIKAFNICVKYVFSGEKPSACPLFEEDDFCVERKFIRGARYISKGEDWLNFVTRLALMITSLWTGGNLSPLSQLKKNDVKSFKKGDGNNYTLNSIKSRAQYERQGLEIGFNKRSKEFIENWLLVSEIIAPGHDSDLFPYLNKAGNLTAFSCGYPKPHQSINKKLTAMGLPEITTRILRSTRSSTLMRAYDDVFIVASANKNTVESTSQHYLEGAKETHEMQLASAFQVQKAMVGGMEKKKAIDKYAQSIKDPFTQDEWLEKKKNALANKTLSGVRCTEPFGEKAKKSLRKYRKLEASNDGACIDFLDCFECPYHALIAEVDDIWLMLSFRSIVISSISRPSINSVPSEKFGDVLVKVELILNKFKSKSEINYKHAVEKNSKKPHPLYSDEDSINDLLGIYQ